MYTQHQSGRIVCSVHNSHLYHNAHFHSTCNTLIYTKWKHDILIVHMLFASETWCVAGLQGFVVMIVIYTVFAFCCLALSRRQGPTMLNETPSRLLVRAL